MTRGMLFLREIQLIKRQPNKKEAHLDSKPRTKQLTRTLQVAHWLYEQQCIVTAKEAAEIFGGSVWSMNRTFSKIRLLTNILVIDEQKIRGNNGGGVQSRMRIVHIYPYTLDENQHIHSQRDNADQQYLLTWHDLLCRSWNQLMQMQASRKDN